MLESVTAVMASSKAAFDMSKALLNLKEGVAVQEKAVALTSILIDLQQHVLDAKQEQMELLDRITGLEAEKAALLDQSKVLARYALKRFVTGHYAYTLKPEFQTDQDEVYLCSRCFESGKRFTLHGTTTLTCPDCKTEIRTKPRQPISVPRTRY